MIDVLASDASDRFRIYLNDHRGVLAGEHALAKRSRRANAGTSLGDLLHSIVVQLEADQVVLDRLLTRVGGSANPFKRYGAMIGERFGRLKLNGQFSGYSPLSCVVEIEGLLAASAMRRAMWNAIAALQIDHDVPTNASLRAETADDQFSRLTKHHVEAMLSAVDGAL